MSPLQQLSSKRERKPHSRHNISQNHIEIQTAGERTTAQSKRKPPNQECRSTMSNSSPVEPYHQIRTKTTTMSKCPPSPVAPLMTREMDAMATIDRGRSREEAAIVQVDLVAKRRTSSHQQLPARLLPLMPRGRAIDINHPTARRHHRRAAGRATGRRGAI